MGDMPVLFCNISWMKRYAGRDEDDPPLGGGGFPITEGYCGEECNFVSADDGFVYGHFETIKRDVDRKVSIERLGADRSDQVINGVDIIWTAPEEGHDPRIVVGWYRDAQLYRARQRYNKDEPSARHRNDEIKSYMVRARAENAYLIPPEERRLRLQRGKGWSGQASWWYAEETADPRARAFVRKVLTYVNRQSDRTEWTPRGGWGGKRAGRAGAATSTAYMRYVREYEVKVHPQHDRLHKRFVAFLRKRHSQVEFPDCFRDDLRYVVEGEQAVMVEIKPADPATVRYAIRTAVGQLLDYRQQQDWNGRQMILVGAEVSRDDDLRLAIDNGFGLAWPVGTGQFEVHWPGSRRKSAQK